MHGAFFPDGVGLIRSMLRADATPTWLYQTTAPGLGEQFSKAIGPENTEGIFYAVSWAPQAKTPGNDAFVKKFADMFGGEPAEDAGDAYAAAQVLQAAVEAVGSIDDQSKLSEWLHANTVDTILGKLNWDDDGPAAGPVPHRPVAERQGRVRPAVGHRDVRPHRRWLEAREVDPE